MHKLEGFEVVIIVIIVIIVTVLSTLAFCSTVTAKENTKRFNTLCYKDKIDTLACKIFVAKI